MLPLLLDTKKLATMMKKIFGVVTILALTVSVGFAQKYGHLNFGNLLSEMPEVQSANSNLETYQEGLIAKGEAMAKEFQTEYGQFAAAVQSGTLSPVEQQKQQEALEAKQNEIMSYEQLIQQQVQGRRAELLQPIVAKVEKAIADVAEEGGYYMVFDTSVFNAILFAEESEDLTAQVKAKLGI